MATETEEIEAEDVEQEELRAEIAVREARAARFGNWGRAICAAAVVALCICLGMGSVGLRIGAGVGAGVVIVGYLVGVMILTKRLDALRRRLKTDRYVPTPFFTALAEEFDRDELARFTARVAAKETRAFRDPRVLETQFTFAKNLVISCEFDNTEARLIVNFRTDAPYRLAYDRCASAEELFDALVAQIEELERV